MEVGVEDWKVRGEDEEQERPSPRIMRVPEDGETIWFNWEWSERKLFDTFNVDSRETLDEAIYLWGTELHEKDLWGQSWARSSSA